MSKEQSTLNTVPPVNKRSFVSEEYDIKKVAEEARKEMEKPDFIPDDRILEIFKVEKLHDIAVALNQIVGILQTENLIKPTVMNTVASVAQKPSRVQEVEAALKDFVNGEQAILTIDDKTSAQYIIVKAKGWLGGNNFPTVANIIKNELGGEYVSAGKGSHFRVPKIKK